VGNLFDLIDTDPRSMVVPNDTWRPEAPPELSRYNEVILNFETTGLRWFEGDKPLAASVYAGDRSWYLPWGHRGGGNLDEAVVKEWALRELRGKLITNINTRFDIHMARVWGVDLEEQGNRVSDVSHYAALLDDHRKSMSLDSLIYDFLGEKPMERLDESRMLTYSAGAAAPRARYNVEMVKRLKDVMWPRMDKEDLQRVRQLEDEVIFVVCEMEKNGTLINQELLHQWIKETKSQYNSSVMQLFKITGLKLNPSSAPDANKLFKYLHIASTALTDSGNASYSDAVLKAVDHPTVKLFRHAKKLASINSKLEAYARCISSDGVLRYALHQLRAERPEGGETGTVTGRFTSTEIVRGVGRNIQQVMKPAKQMHTMGEDFFIRNLHVPAKGQLWLASDAAQIQYRIFAHEAKNARVLAAYKADPWLSFHRMMLTLIREHKPDFPYGKVKDLNFAKIFAAGPSKLALMLGFINEKQFNQLQAERANRYHPLLASTLEVLKIYSKTIPEVDQLLRNASEKARLRGYVRTIMGRRMRFPGEQRLHKALNGRIQGSEADIVKTKAIELHKERKETGLTLRFSVHDEFDGDVPDQESAKRVDEVLNRQSFDLSVPILWETNTGVSWGDCAREEIQKIREELAEASNG